MTDRIKSFKEFWPYYLKEHSKPETRNIHVAGTAGAIGLIGLGVATGQLWLPLAGLGVGYGSAWTAHAFVEKNKPATFTYPLWSLMGDFKMLGHYVTGTLQREVDRHLGPKQPEAQPVPASAPSPGKSFMQRFRSLTQQFRAAISSRRDEPAVKPAPQPKPQPQPPAPKP